MTSTTPFGDEPGRPPAGGPGPDPTEGSPVTFGQPAYGQPAPGQASYGQPSYGQPSYGQPPTGQPPMGQPAYGQPPVGHSGPGQTGYGQPVYNQPAYGAQPPYGAAAGDGYAQPSAGGSSAWSGGGGDEVGSGGPSTGGGASKRALVPWIIGLVVVLVLGGSAVAVRAALSGDTAGPANALPASTLLFARLDVDPDADQKIKALQLASRFPSFGEATGITDTGADLRSSLFDAIKGEAPGLSDMDYEQDVAPWLGSKVGVAVLAPAGDDGVPGVALAVEVTDEDAAADGIAKLLTAADGTQSAGVAFAGSYAVLAQTQELADSYVAAAEDSPLSSNEEFEADMASLGDEGIASAWVSSDAYDALSEIATTMGGAAAGTDLGIAAPALPMQTGSAAYAVRFEDRYVEIAMVGSGSEVSAANSDSDSPIVGLPDSTLFAMSIANGGTYVQQALDQMSAAAEQTGLNFQREITKFERQTGLSVPDDFVTLLGDHFTVAVDSDLGSLESPADLRVGALLDTDAAAAQTVIDKLVTLAGGGIDLATVETDGMLAVGPNEAYAGELTGGSLGDTSAFSDAVAYGADSDVALFLNVDQLEGIDEVTASMDAETLANVSPLQAVGVSVELTGDGDSRGSFRITVNE